MIPPAPVSLLEQDGQDGQRDTRARTRDPWGGARGTRLLCAACGRAITAAGWGIRIAGAHEHSFVNPHGLLFRIACFREAPGCSHQGERHHEYSWFPGHSWEIAGCAGCGTHLGWRFERADDRFHGLVQGRLVQESRGEDGEA